MNEIHNSKLKVQVIPQPGAGWVEISGFAHSFNGYEHWGSFEKCGDVANSIRDVYKASGELSTNLTDLRTCLFFEARRWRHYGYDPDEEALRYIRALMEVIRVCVQSENFD